MDIFLHLGAHRTGTTALQNALQSRRRKLNQNRAIEFWGPVRTRHGLMRGVIKNPDTLTPADTALCHRSCGRIRMELSRLEQMGIKRLIMSEENLLGTMAQNHQACALYGQARARLRRIAPAFEGHNLHIGLGIRRYDIYWASAFAYRTKAGASLPSVQRVAQIALQPRRWRHLVSDIKAVFPKAPLSVWDFDDAMRVPNMVFQQMGDFRIKGPLTPANRSATSGYLAEICADRGDIAGVRWLLEQGAQSRYMPFDAEQIAALRRSYDQDLGWLAADICNQTIYLRPPDKVFVGCDMVKGSRYDDEERGPGQRRMAHMR